jgi:hypothetical protein
MEIAIIGAGTYGSYVADALQKKYPDSQLTVFDVGDSRIKSEQEMGFFSSLKRSLYKGLTDGRWFGFGGASAKWGGQLLMFTENDFANPNMFMQDIISFDKIYKESVLAKFNIVNNYPEHYVTDGLFIKTGVWLSVFKRNFFKIFRINRRENIKIFSNCRIVRFESADKKRIDKVIYLENGIEKEKSFDYYFLTAGAFESIRILLCSGLIKDDKVHFSDHLSQKVFKIRQSTKIGDEDFVFRMKGTSLITKRLTGEIDGVSFYAHPVFNMNFPFFESVKTLLFKREFSWQAIRNIFIDIPNVIGFVWTVLIKRRMFVLNNEWFLYIDIENPAKDNYVELSQKKDRYGVEGLDVYYGAGYEAEKIYDKAKILIKKHLLNNKIDFEILAEKIDIQTCEDIYHPYGMFDFKSAEDYFTCFENMLIVSTGVLPRSGGINPTAALLPVIEKFINDKLI